MITLNTWPEITEADKAAVMATLENGQLYGGEPVAQLEDLWSQYVGRPAQTTKCVYVFQIKQ